MFLHLGQNEIVPSSRVIGIFDLDTASVSAETKRFLRNAEKKKILEDEANGEIPRSFLLLDRKNKGQDKEQYVLKLSLISSAGLKLRLLRLAEDTEE